MNSFDESIEVYLKKCDLEKKLDRKSIKAYRCDLYQFSNWLNAQSKDFVKSSISDYLAYLNSRFSASSTKRKIASLRAFAFYRENEDLDTNNPFYGLRVNFRETKMLPKTVSISVLEKLFREVSAKQDSGTESNCQKITAARDRAILELLIATGMRVSEICNLDISSFDKSSKALRIFGKGKRERVITLENPNTFFALTDYLSHRKGRCSVNDNPGNLNNSEPLFLNRYGKRITERSIRDIITKHAKKAGVSERITPHMFRHTFATLLLESDIDIRYIQKFLGHSSIKTTELYTHVSSAKLRKILQENNPREAIQA